MIYIFDFDGTLVDSMEIFSRSMVRILDENNILYPDNIVEILTPLGYKGTADYAIGLGLKISADEFIRKATEYNINEYSYHIPAKSFVKETLIRLKNGGNSLNVLTASPHTMLDVCLKRLDMYDLFDNVWSCDDFGLTKDNCEIYLNAARRLNTSVEKCCFIDDNINAVSAAKKAGMTAIGIYDQSSDTLVDRMKKISDRYIYDFREL